MKTKLPTKVISANEEKLRHRVQKIKEKNESTHFSRFSNLHRITFKKIRRQVEKKLDPNTFNNT